MTTERAGGTNHRGTQKASKAAPFSAEGAQRG